MLVEQLDTYNNYDHCEVYLTGRADKLKISPAIGEPPNPDMHPLYIRGGASLFRKFFFVS